MSDYATDNAVNALQHQQIFSRLVGESPAFTEVVRQLPGLAYSTASVLIEGETGTGKELVARALHYLGYRASFPFIPVNCGALSDTLLQDELFGHERGAFTDARERRSGLLAQAERGTLFLDEADSLAPRAQVALLRVLQDGTFRALGGSHEKSVDVRFIAATNRPLAALIEAGEFRKDLYYRLCVYSLNLPPLRDRKEDVLRLAEHFIGKHGPPDARLEFSAEARAALLAFDWPGNIRELENAVLRGIQRSRNGSISAADIGLSLPSRRDAAPVFRGSLTEVSLNAQKKRLIDALEREYLTQVMHQHGGNITRAASAAGRERRDFGKLLKKHGIQPGDFSNSDGQAAR
jgi:DNA-binding NtrC family response regulator